MKHRLAGAAILIGFAVVVLPLLLGGPRENPRGDGEAVVSDGSDTEVFRSSITPIGGATPGAESTESSGDLGRTVSDLLGRPADGDRAAPAEDTASESSATETTVATAAPAADNDATTESPAQAEDDDAQRENEEPSTHSDGSSPIDRGWVVQVGTFGKPQNVERLVAKLKQNGFEASTTDIQTSSGSATRVWVGPYATRVEAARMKNRVTQHTQGDALIVAYP